MITSNEVKKWLKSLGLNANKARSISGKRNGVKVVHYIEIRSGSLEPVFPVEMRKVMLRIIYGDDFVPRTSPNPNAPAWVAGNVMPHMVNMTPGQWQRLKDLPVCWRTIWYDDEVVA